MEMSLAEDRALGRDYERPAYSADQTGTHTPLSMKLMFGIRTRSFFPNLNLKFRTG